MIISFKVTNFRSICDPLFIDFTRSKRVTKKQLPQNFCSIGEHDLLHSLIMYGRNASGKSNILLAIEALKRIVIESGEFRHRTEILQHEPFIFEKNRENAPTEFEIHFISESKIRFQYIVHLTKDKIIFESLHFFLDNEYEKLFERKDDIFSYSKNIELNINHIEEQILPNQLFLSKSANSKIRFLKDAYLFFNSIIYSSSIRDTNQLFSSTTINRIFNNPVIKGNLIKLLKATDTNIADFNIEKISNDDHTFPNNIPINLREILFDRYGYEIKAEHPYFINGEISKKKELNVEEESFGTQKLFYVGSLIIKALIEGGLVIIDELDSSLHPQITKFLVNLFHSVKNNPHNAQLIFATHDSSLLDLDIFRKDQILFIEKSFKGNTYSYKLSDFKGVTNNLPLEKWYLSGRFNAIPVINNLELEF